MPKQQEFNFEKSFSELEAIVEKFESGTISLDDSLQQFERGLKLATQLKKHLGEVENKITELKQKFEE